MQILLLTSRDRSLLSQAVTDAVNEFLGSESKEAALTRFEERDYLITPENGPPHKDIGVIVHAAQTPPMLASKRAILARELGYLGSTKAAFAPLLKYLEHPSPDTSVILVWEPGQSTKSLATLPQSLSKAVRAAGGEVRDVSPGRPKKGHPNDWFDQQLDKSGVRLSGRARAMVWDWLGQQHGHLAGLLEVLVATYGTDRMLEEDEVSRFLNKSEEGSIPFWNLTNAIDEGRRDLALDTLRRLLSNGANAPIQVIFMLHRHFEQMLRLDGTILATEAEIASCLKLPANQKFRAKKIAAQTRSLGSEKIARCIRFIAAADLDLRGRSGLEPEIVLEILVARLASQKRWVA